MIESIGEGKSDVTQFDCYRILGLQPGAHLRQIHRAYKRLVLAHHPDRTAGDRESLAMFCRVTEAYATLKRSFHIRERSSRAAACGRCGRIADLFIGVDRKRYCLDCLLPSKRRLLPMPIYVTVRCLAAIGLQILALYSLVVSMTTGNMRHGVAALVLIFAALGALAYNVFSADVIER